MSVSSKSSFEAIRQLIQAGVPFTVAAYHKTGRYIPDDPALVKRQREGISTIEELVAVLRDQPTGVRYQIQFLAQSNQRPQPSWWPASSCKYPS